MSAGWCSGHTFRASVDGIMMHHVEAAALIWLRDTVHVVALCRAVEVDFDRAITHIYRMDNGVSPVCVRVRVCELQQR